jgi:hypothetical protein
MRHGATRYTRNVRKTEKRPFQYVNGGEDTLMYYEQILFNEVIYHLEQKWQRKLNDHEKNVLIEGYKFGRKVEAECELKILEVK